MSEIDRAVEILRAGGLVAFPTETVYGLGADATNAEAVAKIFLAKGRPSTNPLIVHVADERRAKRYAAMWDERAEKLAKTFWPGPLTLVVPKNRDIVDAATAGRATVGLRVPRHPLALQLLNLFDGPIAAPSANRSTRISPTTAQHVRDELGNSVDLILDGGSCEVGIESTVLDLTGPSPIILRPGHVTLEQIQVVLGEVRSFSGAIDPTMPASSPGQHALHYSPGTPTFRFEFEDRQIVLRKYEAMPRFRYAALLVGTSRDLVCPATFSPQIRVMMPNQPASYAQCLYDVLRSVDAGNFDAILIEMPPDEPQWLAVRDRLNRATRPM